MPCPQILAESVRDLGLVAQVNRRNLICHIYPHREGGHWRHAVAHLRARWSLFTGSRTVSVALSDCSDSLDDVKAEFGDCEAEFLSHQNTELQEVQNLMALLRSVEREPGITLYCHAKGCTHVADNAASHAWCDAMAAACLDYPDLVDCMLRDGGTCGAFRSTQRIGWSNSPWHFAGTWFWFRNDRLFAREWGDFEQVFWGLESYPGRHFAHDESRCLFFDHAETAHLYGPDFWRSNIGPAFRAWREKLLGCGLRPLCDRPPLSVLGREVLA